MNDALRDMLKEMIVSHYIGGRHIPEDRLIIRRLKLMNKHFQKEFYSEYHEYINRGFFIRLKKKTGKGTDYHISLDPGFIAEIRELVRLKDEI